MDPQVIHVLLVEADIDYSALLRRRLMGGITQQRSPVFTVAQACLLQEAIAYAAIQAIDVVVVDLHLPDADGLDSLIRLQAAAPDAAIIVLTGREATLDASQALALGAQDYLVKGNFNGEVLVRAIRYALDRKEREQALNAATNQLDQAQQSPGWAGWSDELIQHFTELLSQMANQNSLALSALGNDNPARAHVEKLDQTIHLASILTQRLLERSK